MAYKPKVMKQRVLADLRQAEWYMNLASAHIGNGSNLQEMKERIAKVVIDIKLLRNKCR